MFLFLHKITVRWVYYSLSTLKLPRFVGGAMPYKARMVGSAVPNANPSSHGGTRALRVAPLRV
ncbi:hypothetical protein NUACC26_048510 [Scytonema sp. NUACC26]